VKRLLVVFVFALSACSSRKIEPLPTVVYHWVWYTDDEAVYQDQFGYWCGHIQRTNGGRVYVADAQGPMTSKPRPASRYHTAYNDFNQAVILVEQDCR
jgi:hypothetical protein